MSELNLLLRRKKQNMSLCSEKSILVTVNNMYVASHTSAMLNFVNQKL